EDFRSGLTGRIWRYQRRPQPPCQPRCQPQPGRGPQPQRGPQTGPPQKTGPGRHQHRYGPQTQRTCWAPVAAGAVAASWPLIGMADAVPAIMPAPARMAKAAVAILSLSIALLDLFSFSNMPPPRSLPERRVTTLKIIFNRRSTM